MTIFSFQQNIKLKASSLSDQLFARRYSIKLEKNKLIYDPRPGKKMGKKMILLQQQKESDGKPNSVFLNFELGLCVDLKIPFSLLSGFQTSMK